MKYWRGYLVALIFTVFSWALLQFAASHKILMDMVYPYMTRLIQTSLAGWSGSVDFCIWQLVVLVFAAGVAGSIVLMVVLKWNPIQWFGWVMAIISIATFLNTGFQGMNQYSGSIADDMRFENGDCTVEPVKNAALYYRKKAQEVSLRAAAMKYDFNDLNAKAADGFKALTYEDGYAIFAGCTTPVKQLAWSDHYTSKGVTGVTIAVTGESAVNMQTPQALLPYAICREMCSRMSISRQPDINFAAVLACIRNDDPRFQYAGYLMAYLQCMEALEDSNAKQAPAALKALYKAPTNLSSTEQKAWQLLSADQKAWQDFVGENKPTEPAAVLLTNWYLHITKANSPADDEQAVTFDPTDVTHPNLAGL